MTPTDAVLILLSAGWSEPQIATATGTTQPTVNRIRNGKSDPAWPLGQRIVDLAEAGAQPPEDQAA